MLASSNRILDSGGFEHLFLSCHMLTTGTYQIMFLSTYHFTPSTPLLESEKPNLIIQT